MLFTIIEEKITHAAGATAPVGMSPDRMKSLILNEGLEPVERDALYERFSYGESFYRQGEAPPLLKPSFPKCFCRFS